MCYSDIPKCFKKNWAYCRDTRSRVLKPVQFADWAAPIMPVLKSEKKSVGIFDDSVNQVSRGDSYPLTKPLEDLFTQLALGMSKSQLSQRDIRLQQMSALQCERLATETSYH